MKERIELLVKMGMSEKHAVAFCKGIWVDAQNDVFVSISAAEHSFNEQIIEI